MANFYLSQPAPLVKQSTLPHNIPKREYTPGSGNYGLVLGIVQQVNYKRGTVDVAINSGAQGSQGQLVVEALLPTQFFGNDDFGNYYGTANYPSEGSYVVIGYLGGYLSSPVVVNFYANSLDNYQNIATSSVEYHSDKDSQYKDVLLGKKTVYPSQEMSFVSGNGNYYRTFWGNSFLQIDDDKYNYMLDDSYDGSNNGYFINPKTGKRYVVPGKAQRVLFNHASQTKDDLHRTKWFIDRDGTVVFSMTNVLDPKKLYREMFSLNGGHIATRQFDTNVYGESTQYTQTYFTSNNTYLIKSVQGSSIGSIEVTPTGTLIDGLHIASESSFQTLSTQYEKLDTSIDQLTSTVSGLNPDVLSTLPDKVDNLDRDVGNLSTKVDGAVATGNTNTQSITDLGTKVDTNYKNTQEAIGSQSDATTKINNRLVNYEGNISRLNTIDSTYANTKAEADDYSARNGTFLTSNSKTISDINSDISSLNTKNDSQDTSISTLNTNYDSLNTAVKGLTTTVGDKVDKSVIDKLNENVNYLAQQLKVTLPNPDIYSQN